MACLLMCPSEPRARVELSPSPLEGEGSGPRGPRVRGRRCESCALFPSPGGLRPPPSPSRGEGLVGRSRFPARTGRAHFFGSRIRGGALRWKVSPSISNSSSTSPAANPFAGRSTLQVVFFPSQSSGFASHQHWRKSRVSDSVQYSRAAFGLTSHERLTFRHGPPGGQTIVQSSFGIGLSNTCERANAQRVPIARVGSFSSTPFLSREIGRAS